MIKLLLISFLYLCNLKAYEHALVVSAIFKDEAPYFKEWIEYHKMMGVEHFRLYNNDSTDNYLAVLAPYIANGDVTLIDWPSSELDLGSWCSLTQWPMCVDAIVHFTNISEWLAIIDIDEFLHPLDHLDMIAFLKEYEEYPGVVLSWQCFGTNLVDNIPEGKLMIEILTKRAEEYNSSNIPVKSIVKPEYVDISRSAWSPHTFHYIDNGPAVFPDKTRREEHFDNVRWKIKPNGAVINHYSHRTERYFWNERLTKKQRMENGNTDILQLVKASHDEYNKIEDTRILRFVPELRKRMGLDI